MKKAALIIIAILFCLSGKSQYNRGIIIEPILKTDTTAIGRKIIYPDFRKDEITILKITVPPGESTGWHKHMIPVFAYILKGSLTVELEGNKTILLPENSSFSEVFDTYHNGINEGTENVVLIAFYMGEKGKSLSVRKDSLTVK
jgi:quercetin dioxygenase-like cupin family protein